MRDLKAQLDKKAKVAKTTKKTNSNYDAISKILDENNADNITLYDPEQKSIEFEQIALIPIENETTQSADLYAIMIPITPMQGVNEGEGVIFRINENTRDVEVVNDQDLIDRILDIYQKLLDEGEEGNK